MTERSSSNRARLDNSELVKTGFWVGQIFMLLATVLGVYLASREGLNQALEFDDINSMQNNYYLRRSLRDEVSDNVDALRDYVKFIKEHQQTPNDMAIYHPQISRYVWNTMKYSEYTLQTPPQFISSVRRFYATTDDLLDKGARRVYGRHYLMPRLLAAADKMEATIPAMNKDLATLKQHLKDVGSPIE